MARTSKVPTELLGYLSHGPLTAPELIAQSGRSFRIVYLSLQAMEAIEVVRKLPPEKRGGGARWEITGEDLPLDIHPSDSAMVSVSEVDFMPPDTVFDDET